MYRPMWPRTPSLTVKTAVPGLISMPLVMFPCLEQYFFQMVLEPW